MLKEHEKFWSFMALGFAVLGLAVLAVFFPIPDGSGSQRIVDAAMGGLLLALGAASNALFRVGTSAENEAIGQATVQAFSASNTTLPVTVENTAEEPVPTTSDAVPENPDLPPMFKEDPSK